MRWLFVAQVTMLEGLRGWSALVVAVMITTVALIVGLICLIAFTGLPLWALSAIVVPVDLLAMPYGVLVLTSLYGDARAATVVDTLAMGDTEPTHAWTPTIDYAVTRSRNSASVGTSSSMMLK